MPASKVWQDLSITAHHLHIGRVEFPLGPWSTCRKLVPVHRWGRVVDIGTPDLEQPVQTDYRVVKVGGGRLFAISSIMEFSHGWVREPHRCSVMNKSSIEPWILRIWLWRGRRLTRLACSLEHLGSFLVGWGPQYTYWNFHRFYSGPASRILRCLRGVGISCL